MSLAGRHHQFRHRDWYISNVNISILLLGLIFFKIRTQSAIQINNLIWLTDAKTHESIRLANLLTLKQKSDDFTQTQKVTIMPENVSCHDYLCITVQTFKAQHKPNPKTKAKILKFPWNFVKVTVRLTWSQTSKRSSELWTVISLKHEVVNILNKGSTKFF